MHAKWVFKHFQPWPGRRIRRLTALWIMGLLIGIILCNRGSFDAVRMLSGMSLASPAPPCLFLVCFLPVVLIAIALTSPFFQISYLAVFLSAVSHGFCGTLVYMAQGSAAWLLRPLLLFSASCTSVLMWWLLLQSMNKGRLYRNIRLAGALACFIYLIDLFLVSPFVSDLVKYF